MIPLSHARQSKVQFSTTFLEVAARAKRELRDTSVLPPASVYNPPCAWTIQRPTAPTWVNPNMDACDCATLNFILYL